MGGVAGALATHADQVVASLAHGAQRVARTMFQRLVTSEGTRALVDHAELLACGPAGDVQRVLAALVEARLVVLHEDTATVEIIHEALVAQWPTLRRWMEEGREDTVFVEEVRAAARQWDSKGRQVDLLWRGAAAAEAARFDRRFAGTLAPRERAFLDAVAANDRRAGRRKRLVITSVITVLAAMVAASVAGMLWIRQAESDARRQADVARTETARAKEAERKVTEQLDLINQAQADRRAASEAAAASAAEAEERRAEAAMSREQLEEALRKAQGARADAEKALAKAETARKSEQEARQKVQDLLAKEKERVRELEEQRKKIVNTLK